MLGRMTAGVLGATLVFGSIGYGQQQPPDGPPNFAQMRQEMMDRLKEAVGASDDEWKVIQPRIEKVQDLQRQTGGRGPGMFFGPPPGGPGGPGNGGGPGGPPPGGADNANAPQAGRDNGGPGPGGPPPGGPNGGFPGPGGPGGPDGQTPSEVQQKQMDLRETLQSQDASQDEVKAKVTALREARARAKVQLAQAQEELRGVLSLRQEAVLVTYGILE